MTADYHIHTEFSDDSTAPMQDVVEAALAVGLDEICFTEHVDYGIKLDRDADHPHGSDGDNPGVLYNADYDAYFARVAQLRDIYRGRIALKQGLEFGVQTHTVPLYRELFSRCPLDFVLLSCHQVDDKEFWTNEFQNGRTPAAYNAAYYQEIYDCMLVYKDYSVLGHLDMIQRHNDPPYPFEASKDILAKILQLAIADGKGIEINTSSFLYGLEDLMPARDILRLYRELGGTVLTIGSDSHEARRVGEHVAYAQQELKALGFTSFCTFERMVPTFHPLP